MAKANKTEKERIAEILEWVKEEGIPDISTVLPFMPTEGLTPEKRKMLAAMSIPAIARENQVVQSAYAGVNRMTWAKYAQDPDFQEIVAKHLRTLLGKAAPKVLHSYIAAAFLPSPQKPFGDIQAQQRILEQAQILDTQAKSGTSVQVNVVVVNEKRQENIKTGLARFGVELMSDN